MQSVQSTEVCLHILRTWWWWE